MNAALRAARVFALAVVGGAGIVACAAQAAQDRQAPTPTLRMHVRLVDVLTSVTDANGAPIGGLGAGDFAVFDNGVQQKITVFERETNMPLNLVVALDTSGSVRKDMAA